MADNLVFRFAATGHVAGIIQDVVSQIRKSVCRDWEIGMDAANPKIGWYPVYSGFCTCGFDEELRIWMLENPHSRSCHHPDNPCSCGQWAELDRWRDGQGHRKPCKKAVPNLIIGGLGLFLDPGGKMYTDKDYTITQWREWRNRAITIVVNGGD